jgi:hypothetical protein
LLALANNLNKENSNIPTVIAALIIYTVTVASIYLIYIFISNRKLLRLLIVSRRLAALERK